MNSTEITDVLERRHSQMVEWDEIRPAVGPTGNVLNAYITVRASVNDCINLHRLDSLNLGESTAGNDGARLVAFMTSKFAKFAY